MQKALLSMGLYSLILGINFELILHGLYFLILDINFQLIPNVLVFNFSLF
jgi:hypothetical protein